MSVMDISEWIRTARAQAKLTQSQLGEHMGVTKANVSGWETGRHVPSYTQMVQISAVTKVKLPHEASPDLREPESRLPRRIQRLPVAGTAKMESDGYFDQVSEESGAGEGRVEVATEDPSGYCLRVRGQGMFPAIRDNWYVVLEPNGAVKEGEYVLIKLLNGRKTLKELLFHRGTTIEVMSVTGDQRSSFEISEIREMQPVGALVPPSKWHATFNYLEQPGDLTSAATD